MLGFRWQQLQTSGNDVTQNQTGYSFNSNINVKVHVVGGMAYNSSDCFNKVTPMKRLVTFASILSAIVVQLVLASHCVCALKKWDKHPTYTDARRIAPFTCSKGLVVTGMCKSTKLLCDVYSTSSPINTETGEETVAIQSSYVINNAGWLRPSLCEQAQWVMVTFSRQEWGGTWGSCLYATVRMTSV